jgi:hypothetical protein
MSKNGSGAAAESQETLSPGVYFDRGIFVTRSGATLTLKKTNPLLIERLANSITGKPEAPLIEVNAPGGRKRKETARRLDLSKLTSEQLEKADPVEVDYNRAVDTWEREKNLRLLVYLFSQGIVEDPPEEFVEQTREFLPGESESTYKYLWVASLLEGDAQGEEATALVTATMGLVYPTEGGLAQTADSFPGDGQRVAD